MPVSVRCPACNSERTRLHLDGPDELSLECVGSSRTKLSHGRILRCNHCRTCFRSFRPDLKQLAALYQQADDAIYQAEIPNRLKTAEKHRQIIERCHPQPGVLIDVGCGPGAFLRLMADRGWKVFGVEPSGSQYQRALAALGGRGVVQHAILEEATLPGNADVVTLWDVLEHVLSPVEFLQKCASLLSPGGCLVLNVPAIDSLPAKLLGSRWPLLLAEHLNYFSVPGLRVAGDRAGLKLTATGSRPVFFSLGYIFYRLAQHGLPGASSARQLVSHSAARQLSVPIRMGETYCIFSKQ